MKCLVEHGADINKENRLDETPLLYLFYSRNDKLIKYLIQHGAKMSKLFKSNKLSLSEKLSLLKYLKE